MLRRVLFGLLKGAIVGGLLATALVYGLGMPVIAPWLAYLAAVVTGAVTGLVAGKPIWTKDLTGQLDTLIKAQQVITRRLMTRRALMEYSLEWQRMAAEIRAWRGTLQNRLAALQKGRDEVSALIGQWTATIRLARSDSTNRDVLSLAEETLRRARDSEQRIRGRTDELLGAEVRLSEAQLKTEQHLDS